MKRAGLLLLGLLATVPAWAADLTVSAASSLTESFRELGAAYERAHPGTKVDFNFAASGVLLQQISRGAPVDVFASADETTMDQAQQQDHAAQHAGHEARHGVELRAHGLEALHAPRCRHDQQAKACPPRSAPEVGAGGCSALGHGVFRVFGVQGLGMPTVSGDTLALPAACCVQA
mgnify:CR=1 FL=1